MKLGLLFKLGKTVMLKFLAFFFSPPRCSQLNPNFLSVQLLFFFLAEDNWGQHWLQCGCTCLAPLVFRGNEAGLFMFPPCFAFHVSKMCFYIKYLRVFVPIYMYIKYSVYMNMLLGQSCLGLGQKQQLCANKLPITYAQYTIFPVNL